MTFRVDVTVIVVPVTTDCVFMQVVAAVVLVLLSLTGVIVFVMLTLVLAFGVMFLSLSLCLSFTHKFSGISWYITELDSALMEPGLINIGVVRTGLCVFMVRLFGLITLSFLVGLWKAVGLFGLKLCITPTEAVLPFMVSIFPKLSLNAGILSFGLNLDSVG